MLTPFVLLPITQLSKAEDQIQYEPNVTYLLKIVFSGLFHYHYCLDTKSYILFIFYVEFNFQINGFVIDNLSVDGMVNCGEIHVTLENGDLWGDNSRE